MTTRFVDTMDVLESLNDSERRKIMEVLQRDLELQHKEAEKIGCLRQEIQLLRRHSDTNLLHDSNSSLRKSLSPRHCRRCGVVLGLLFKTGTPCPKCRHRVCLSCRKALANNKWMCVLCYKNREYAAVTGEWFFSQGQKQRGENDYIPSGALKGSSPTLDIASGGVQDSLCISKTLLKELQKAEKRRQVNSVKTADELCYAMRNNKLANQTAKKPNIISAAMKEVSSLMTSPDVNKRMSSWHPNHLANMVLALTNRKDKARPQSVQGTSDDDSVQSADGITTGHLVIPSVKVEEEWTNENHLTVERKLSNVLRSPSVPFFNDSEYANGSAAINYRERKASKCVQKIPSASRAESMNRKISKNQSLSPVFNQKWASDLNLAAGSNRDSVASNADDNSSVISGDSIGNKNTLRTGSVLSLTSLYSNAGEANAGKIEIRGRVLLLLVYDCKAAVLDINVRQCEDLAAVDAKRNRSNPYVKTYLLPDRSTNSKRKTKVKRHTVNPTFEETLKPLRAVLQRASVIREKLDDEQLFNEQMFGEQFTYSGLTKSELESRTLLLSVWHYDMLGRNDFLGETHIPLSEYPWGRQVYGFWYDLQPKQHNDQLEFVENSFRGVLDLSIKFVPPFVGRGGDQKFGSFQCLIRKAGHLQSVRSSGTADPFVKAYLHPITAKSTKQKSSVIKNDLNPVWNCSFEYNNVNLNILKQSSLELTVWDHQRFGSNEFLGGIRLNLGSGFCNNVEVDWMDAQEKEQSMWRTMIERPNVWSDATIPLRASMSVIN